jgi:hypothetical protein
VDFFDRLALAGRRFERVRSPATGSTQLTLEEVLRVFQNKTLLELETTPAGQDASSALHETGRPISIIDCIAAITATDDRWYEVMQTAPSGDYARFRISAMPSGGHIACLVGRRSPEHHVAEDPILEHLRTRV